MNKLPTINCKLSTTRGFSLVEIMVAVALFAVVMTISTGALLSLIDANRKAQALNSVINNLNFALENMSRNIRVGSTYHCSTSSSVPPDLDTTENCSGGGVLFAFEKTGGDSNYRYDQVIYRFINPQDEPGYIDKSIDGGATFIRITAPEVTINDMKFYVTGSEDNDDLQPKVIIIIQGSAGISAKARTNFNLQTTISQRILDLRRN